MDFIYGDAAWDTPEASADIICQNPQRVKCGQQGYDMKEADIQAMREGLNDTQRFVFDAIMREVEPDQTVAHDHTPRRHFENVRDGCHQRFRLYMMDKAEGCEPRTHATMYALGVLSAMVSMADSVIAECGENEREIRKLFTHYVYNTAQREIEHKQRFISSETLDSVSAPPTENGASAPTTDKSEKEERKRERKELSALEEYWKLLEQFFTERGREREFRYFRAAYDLYAEFESRALGQSNDHAPHRMHLILSDALLISPENSRTLMKNALRIYREFIQQTYFGG